MCRTIVGLLCAILVLFLAPFCSLGMEYPSSGVDLSSFRCSGGIVSTGDLMREVLSDCGEPDRETRLLDESHRIWIYNDDSKFVTYFAFLHQRVQRIYRVRCWRDTLGCE